MLIDGQSAVSLFEAVRALPYTTNAGYDADTLLAQGRGNCVAKASLLHRRLTELAVRARLVRWEYELPVLMQAQADLGFTRDIHTTLQVHDGGQWQIVDPTRDPALAALGLVVGQWDGRGATAPAYPPAGPIWVVGEPEDDAAWRERLEGLTAQVLATPREAVVAYREQLNALMDSVR